MPVCCLAKTVCVRIASRGYFYALYKIDARGRRTNNTTSGFQWYRRLAVICMNLHECKILEFDRFDFKNTILELSFPEMKRAALPLESVSIPEGLRLLTGFPFSFVSIFSSISS